MKSAQNKYLSLAVSHRNDRLVCRFLCMEVIRFRRILSVTGWVVGNHTVWLFLRNIKITFSSIKVEGHFMEAKNVTMTKANRDCYLEKRRREQ